MSDEALHAALARMAADSEFRTAVRANDDVALAGLGLTQEELTTLRSVSSQARLYRGGTLSAGQVADIDRSTSEPDAAP
jgi:triphosphoribosyl-dephospho-CoA synthetase